jgi:hypothetical protein
MDTNDEASFTARIDGISKAAVAQCNSDNSKLIFVRQMN